MVFKRVKSIRKKNGKTYNYLYLVKSIWDKEKKRPKQKVLKYLGSVDYLKPYDAKTIFKRDNYKCKNCAAEENLTIDHIIPLVKGGNNDLENLQVLCMLCNLKKGKT